MEVNKTAALSAYRAAFLATTGDEDARDQAGFAAIEAAFPNLTIHEHLDFLQFAQQAMEAKMLPFRRVA